MASIKAEWLTVAEACAYLRVTRATLYRWARQGKLRMYTRVQRMRRLRRSELDALTTPDEAMDYATVVTLGKSHVYRLGPGMATVRDAVSRFAGREAEEDWLVRLNYQACETLDTPLRAGDAVALLPKGGIRAASDEADEPQSWLRLAESTFAKDWDNDKDAIYDDWKELYGVRER